MQKQQLNNSRNNINNIIEHPLIRKIKEISINEHVAILRDQTIELLLDLIDQYHLKTCLEIGSGVGYSASILKIFKNLDITTLEKDQHRYSLLLQNTNELNINCINGDCFEFKPENKYDLIIIDGPKANQITLIEDLMNNLNENGIMFIDNIYLKAFSTKTNLSNNQQKILNEVKKLEKYLINYKNNQCKIYNIDDGVAVIFNHGISSRSI